MKKVLTLITALFVSFAALAQQTIISTFDVTAKGYGWRMMNNTKADSVFLHYSDNGREWHTIDSREASYNGMVVREMSEGLYRITVTSPWDTTASRVVKFGTLPKYTTEQIRVRDLNGNTIFTGNRKDFVPTPFVPYVIDQMDNRKVELAVRVNYL